MNFRYCFFLLVLFQVNLVFSQKEFIETYLDSIVELRLLSQDNSRTNNDRIKLAEQALGISRELNQDSVILKSGRILSLAYYNAGKDSLYLKINHENLRLASKIKDSSSLEVVNSNLGSFFHTKELNDSAFYYYSKALKLYNKSRDIEGKARMLLNIADIQETEKDYIGAEENAVESIKLLNSIKINENVRDRLWILNNLIGIISLKLKNYDKAIEYHNKAQEIAEKMEYGYYNNLYSINNKAIAYRYKNEIDKSIELYEQVISEDSLAYYDSSFYAITLGNLAYTKSFKPDRDIDEIKNIFLLGKRVSDTITDPLAKLGIAIDFSRFYLDIKELDSALYYAKRSYKISNEISNNELKLESLLLLAELNNNEDAEVYLKEHIKLSDSLLFVERNVRNKYARIELETDELEAENKQISKENLYLAILSIGLLLTAILIYVLISQRAKNKELKLQQVQQKANEDIYNLMLGQQDKVDEARAKEKTRVSKELHDGVLGRLFGTRLSLDSINFKDGKEAMMTRANYIGQLKTIEEDIRKISHELNTDFVSGSGFMDIVTELIENQCQAYGLQHEFNYTDDISWDLVSNKTKINFYRIIQESMQNIYKHAKAKKIKISISLEKDVICLGVIDDGEGFDTSKGKKGIGLKNMHSRVEDINGSITFTSQPENGTQVNVKIPYTNQSI
ncbi:tetratricopeptide repeat-containing sensor histidine kinase [uncultured Winogradskyella sp.]|uniref:tetratricopeptide repeat-containing sensor histidine kinase n=1 Tax=uncultured Winogradskyella sp. TaxID=395353 RepID=UPI0026286C83|nr:tetratricopeptide repeat-containing sensor histidine kinase [uncultured Winogradskyella sp.]